MGYSKTLIDWEQDNGQITQVSIAEALTRQIQWSIDRPQLLINILFPELTPYAIQPNDRRYKRNVQRFRAFLQKIIDERRSG